MVLIINTSSRTFTLFGRTNSIKSGSGSPALPVTKSDCCSNVNKLNKKRGRSPYLGEPVQ